MALYTLAYNAFPTLNLANHERHTKPESGIWLHQKHTHKCHKPTFLKTG